jgi:hypothetical protein
MELIGESAKRYTQDKQYFLQTNVTLYNPGVGFFGRTYKGRQIPLEILVEAGELKTEESDWVMFYTMSEAIQTKAVIEIIVIESDFKKGVKKPHGIGYTVAPLFYD